jgi:ABC transporter substrate binding protein (PQQ-dependent alcohol dehydrogenase system)
MKTPAKQIVFFIILGLFQVKSVWAEVIQTVKIIYITQEQKIPAALSNLDAFIQHKGMVGAKIATDDNNTTGQFTGQKFELNVIIVPVEGGVVQAFKQQIAEDIPFVVTNLPALQLKQLADLELAKNKLFFDATTTDDSLRNSQCRNNILHLLPSRAMRADALAQYMMKKKWTKWFLVTGMAKEDQLYAKAIKRAANRFGMKIVTEKQWTHTYDARRTAQSDVPVFTQGTDYDVLVVADEQGLFGEYFDYRSWIPRPVIGTQGLVPTAWHKTHEQWGAVQMQNRFKALAGRRMQEQDYAAYLAIRSIGEAVVRTKSNQMQEVKNYLLGEEFALQGYKGKPLSFRAWNGQLRQPVLLAAARSLVAVAPIDGFLHPKTELDTLGFDQPESMCNRLANSKVEQPKMIEKIENDDVETKVNEIIQQLKDYYNDFNESK